MIKLEDKLTEDQVKALEKIIYCTSTYTVQDVIRSCVSAWGDKQKKVVTTCNALDSVGLSEVIDYTINDILLRLHCLSKKDYSTKTINGLSIEQLTPILCNLKKLSKKEDRFDKVNDISKEELNNYFPRVTKENVAVFIYFCKQGIIDTPKDIASLLGKYSFIGQGSVDTMNWTIDLLNLSKDANILPLFESTFNYYFINNPTLENIKVDVLKDTLILLDHPVARKIEQQLSNDNNILDCQSTFSFNLNVKNIKRIRGNMQLQDDSIDILIENTINCFGKAIKDDMFIFKDYLSNKDFVQQVNMIQNLDRKTKTYLYSRMEFIQHPEENIQFKKEVLNTFFNELVKLEGNSSSEVIFNLMKTTALYYEMHATLPDKDAPKKRSNKI